MKCVEEVPLKQSTPSPKQSKKRQRYQKGRWKHHHQGISRLQQVNGWSKVQEKGRQDNFFGVDNMYPQQQVFIQKQKYNYPAGDHNMCGNLYWSTATVRSLLPIVNSFLTTLMLLKTQLGRR